MANCSFPTLIVLMKLWWNAMFSATLSFSWCFHWLTVHKGIQITQAVEQFTSLFCCIPWQVMGCEVNLRRPCRRRLKSLRSDYTAGCCQVEGSLMRKHMICRFLACLNAIWNSGHAAAGAKEACLAVLRKLLLNSSCPATSQSGHSD